LTGMSEHLGKPDPWQFAMMAGQVGVGG
jgi:hypothetical protein